MIVPDRLSFLLAGANEWWIGDVIGRFSPVLLFVGSTSVIIEEEDDDDEDKDGTSNGGGGAGDANSCVRPVVVAVARDLNVIPYRLGGVVVVVVVVNGYWSINCESRSSLKSNDDEDDESFVGGHGACRQRHTPFPHRRRVCGNVDGGIPVGTTAVDDIVVELDVDEHESVDFLVWRRRAKIPSVTDDNWNWPAFWNARIVTLTARTF